MNASSPSGRRLILVAALLALFAAAVLALFAIICGPLNQDEGWYLLAARNFAAGKLPYRDYFFTQGPALPAIYGVLTPLWERFGVLGGRVLTALLGLVASAGAGLLASKTVPRERAASAGWLGFSLVACNLYHVYFTAIPKTYALASLLVVLAFLALLKCRAGVRLPSAWAALSAFLLSAAAGTRLSLAFALPPVALALLLTRRRMGSWSWLGFGLGGLAGMALVYGWTAWICPDEFLFSQLFHVSRGGRNLMMPAGSVSRIVRAYTSIFALLGGVLVWMAFRRGMREESARVEVSPLALHRRIWLAAAACVFLVQLASPHPYDDYQVPVMGLVAAAVASFVVDFARSLPYARFVCLCGVLLTCFVSFGSSLLQEWFTVRQDRFWTELVKEPDLFVLRRVGREIRELAGNSRELLTPDAYLAVETGAAVPAGLEMGPFSYFPDLNDADARRHHLFNRARLLQLFENAQDEVCAFSEYGWAIASPAMTPVPEEERQQFLSALARRYDEVAEHPDFGQNHTRLRIFKLRK